jgi:hypothetical protein
MNTFEEQLKFIIDEVIRLRLSDIFWLVETKVGLEDKNAIFNAESDIEDKIGLLKAELWRSIKAEYEKRHGATNPESHN